MEHIATSSPSKDLLVFLIAISLHFGAFVNGLAHGRKQHKQRRRRLRLQPRNKSLGALRLGAHASLKEHPHL
jgi:hypothetical protein